MGEFPTNIDHLLRAAQDLEENAFCSRYPTPYLLVEILAGEQRVEKSAWSLETVHLAPSSGAGGAGATGTGRRPAGVPGMAFAVRKEGVDKANLVTIGRTRTSDICLDSKVISKLHAYFSRDPISEGYTVTDAGSANGTVLGGRRLAQGEAMTLRGGEEILFAGHYRALFLLPEQLYVFLRELVGNG